MPVNVSVLDKKPISSWLVCDSHDACLDCVLPGVQVTAGLGLLSALKSFTVYWESFVEEIFCEPPSLT